MSEPASKAGKAWMSWSSGKDSTLALHVARAELGIDVAALLATFNADADRVAMHAVRRELCELQAERMGVQLHADDLPGACSNDVYEQRMCTAVARARPELG